MFPLTSKSCCCALMTAAFSHSTKKTQCGVYFALYESLNLFWCWRRSDVKVLVRSIFLFFFVAFLCWQISCLIDSKAARSPKTAKDSNWVFSGKSRLETWLLDSVDAGKWLATWNCWRKTARPWENHIDACCVAVQEASQSRVRQGERTIRFQTSCKR